MKFNCIEDVKRYIKFLKDSSQAESKWYKDLTWFCEINYTTTSEYFGELKMLVEKLIEDEDFKEYKFELIDLRDTLKFCFK